MGLVTAVPPAVVYSQQDLNDAYSQLLFDLNNAYWAAADMNTKDQIYGYVEVVTNLITQLNAADLTIRDEAYTSISQQVTTVNGQLKTLQQQISTIINRISTVTTILSDITKALTIAAQFFPTI
jgi:hypothetical protein